MKALRATNELVAFLLEMVAVVALVAWGLRTDAVLPVRILLAVGAVAVMVVVWGRWLAPKSPHRLGVPALVGLKVVIFGLVAVALWSTGLPTAAVVFAAVVVVNLTLAVLTGRDHRVTS